MKVEISYFEARKPAEFDAAFTAMAKRHAGGVVVTDDPMLNPIPNASRRSPERSGSR
jgi:hypothetical protein